MIEERDTFAQEDQQDCVALPSFDLTKSVSRKEEKKDLPQTGNVKTHCSPECKALSAVLL